MVRPLEEPWYVKFSSAGVMRASRMERKRLVVDTFDELASGESLGLAKGFGRSLPEQIAGILRGDIVERRLPAGARLREPALVKRFETSRAPIREALYLLTQEGLIERAPRKGAVVKGYSKQEILELYKVRIMLDRVALERICEKSETIRACLAALEPIAREMEEAKGETARYRDLNFSFHETIIILSQSDLLGRLYAQIEGPLKIVLRKSFSSEGAMPKSFSEHLQILEAIEKAELDTACAMLQRHDDDGMQRALATLPEDENVL